MVTSRARRSPASETHGAPEAACESAPPEGEAERIADLKDKLAHAEELSKVMDHFFDHFGANPCFMKRGRPVEDAELFAYLARIVHDLVDPPLTLARTCLLHVPEHGMKHGLVVCEGWAGIVVFFDDPGQGMLALSHAGLAGPTLYCRFTRLEIKKAARETSN